MMSGAAGPHAEPSSERRPVRALVGTSDTLAIGTIRREHRARRSEKKRAAPTDAPAPASSA